MEEWIDARSRMPQEGEIISLPDTKSKYRVRGFSLLAGKGQLAIPLCLVGKYKIEK